MARRSIASAVLCAFAFLGLGCNETKTPTEVPAFVAPPTPVPQTASMAGKVTTYGGALVGGRVQCQGRSATTAADGTYDLTGLMSGTYSVDVFYTTTDSYVFAVSLAPGENTQNLFLYE